jgi:DMSO/TMAO reductase YedYZ molybdopterin-dependent catalytic subunit
MPLEALRWSITPIGLHYLLTHYDIPVVDPDSWALTVSGRIRVPLVLSLDDLQARPRRTVAVTMECAGNGRAQLVPRPLSQPWIVEAVGTGYWTGTALAPILDEAGLLDDARQVVFTGLDRGVEAGVEQHYQRALDVKDALEDEVLLAYELNGEPLPPQHGYPCRLVVPGWYGMTNVKWLSEISAVAEPFAGYQQSHAYRLRQHEDEPGEMVTRMAPRALMVPPGIPDFFSRRRFVAIGEHVIFGRAWSGHAPVTAVEVSVDGATTWQPALLADDPVGPAIWRAWTYEWAADLPGEFELCCRARDAAGHGQPSVPDWNLSGYTNNFIQRVPVTVQERS